MGQAKRNVIDIPLNPEQATARILELEKKCEFLMHRNGMLSKDQINFHNALLKQQEIINQQDAILAHMQGDVNRAVSNVDQRIKDIAHRMFKKSEENVAEFLNILEKLTVKVEEAEKLGTGLNRAEREWVR